jgi:hypothetical protein
MKESWINDIKGLKLKTVSKNAKTEASDVVFTMNMSVHVYRLFLDPTACSPGGGSIKLYLPKVRRSCSR